MLNITAEQLIAICGPPSRISGSQYYFRCPVCSAGGGDKHGDNLLFNENKGLLKCYACGGERKVLQMINNKYITPVMPIRTRSRLKVKWFEINTDNIYNYYLATISEPKPFELIYQKFRWPQESLENVGYDPNPSHLFPSLTEPSLIFPVINFEDQIVGFEARAIQEKKLRHTKDLPNCLAFFKRGYKKLVICEGFKDAFTFNLLYPNIERDIATPSNGVGTLRQALESINISYYDEIVLVLDNDRAGSEMTSKIIREFGNRFKDGRKFLKNNKDVWDFFTTVRRNDEEK